MPYLRGLYRAHCPSEIYYSFGKKCNEGLKCKELTKGNLFAFFVNNFVNLFVFLTHLRDNRRLPVTIEKVTDIDFKSITVKRFAFNWKLERSRTVYKLSLKGTSDILGLMALNFVNEEQRIEIKLLAVAIEQVGRNKTMDRIAGNLLAYAARLAVKHFGAWAAISLIPKTALKQHYMDKYGFGSSGISLFMEGRELAKLLKNYDYD